jgi:hypothetical protein
MLVHGGDGMCLAARSSAVALHTQLGLATCDESSKLQQWIVSANGGGDGDMYCIAADTGFCLNVGAFKGPESELQLYTADPSAVNEVFKLVPDDGTLRPAIGNNLDVSCVAVCQQGSPACGGALRK